MRKLLITLLSVLMIITTGTINVAAEGENPSQLTINYYAVKADVTSEAASEKTVGEVTYLYSVQNADSRDRVLNSNQFTHRYGYAFIGWSDTANGPVKYAANATVKDVLGTSGTTADLYAVWSKTLTLKYANINTDVYKDVNPTANNVVLNSSSFSRGNNIVDFTLQPATQVLEGTGKTQLRNVFGGWYYSTDEGHTFSKLGTDGLTISKDLFTTLTATGNATLTLYAKWTYTVRYADKIQDKVTELNYERDTLNTGYIQVAQSENAVSENVYNAPVGTSSYGSTTGPQFKPTADDVTVNNEHYHFLYWDADENHSTASTKYYIGNQVKQDSGLIDPVTFQPTHIRTVFATYEKFGNVVYHNLDKADGGHKNHDYLLQSDLNNEAYSLSVPDGINGYTFAGWWKNSNLSGDNNLVTALTQVPAELYAKWTYKVKYVDSTYSYANDVYNYDKYGSNNSLGGDGYVKTNKDDDHMYVFNDNSSQYLKTNLNINKTGYTISNWNSKVDGSGSIDYLPYQSNGGINDALTGTGIAPGKNIIQNNDLYGTGNVEIDEDGYHVMYVQYTPNIYTVNLNNNGGSGLDNVKVKYDAEFYNPDSTLANKDYSSISTPSRVGYTFKGYWTASSGGIKVIDENGKLTEYCTQSCDDVNKHGYVASRTNGETRTYTWAYAVPTTGLTLYAHWEENYYNVTYNANKPCTHNDHTVSNMPSDTGHWYTNTNWDLANRTPSMVGYDFLGWAESATETDPSKIYASSKKYFNDTTDRTFYAIWKAKETYVTVNANIDGGSISGGVSNGNTFKVTYDQPINLTGLVAYKANYHCVGISTNSSTILDTQKIVSNETISYYTGAEEQRNLYAHWAKNDFTVTYHSNVPTNASHANLPETFKEKYDATVSLTLSSRENGAYGVKVNLQQLTSDVYYSIEGWTFDGWATTKNGLEADGTTSSKVTSFSANHFSVSDNNQNQDLYAQWVQNTATFSFNSNKPSSATTSVTGSTNGGANFVVKYDETDTTKQTLPANGFILKGYTFVNWSSNDTPSKVFADKQNVKNVYAETVTKTLKANWKANEYKLTFKDDKGTVVTTDDYSLDKTATFDSTVSAPTKEFMTREGYDFKGWYVGETKVFDADGKLAIFNTDGSKNTTATSSDYATKLNNGSYVWTKDSNTVLVAKYELHTYNVTYDLNGGSATGNNPTTYTKDTNTFTLSNPTRTGYTFAGWTGTGLTEKTTSVSVAKGSIGNRAYLANWNVDTYNITYVANGIVTGSNTNPATYTIESNDIVLTAPSKVGYTFDGWYSSWNSETGYSNKVTTITHGSTGNVTLHAKFIANTYTVVFDRNEPEEATRNDNFVLSPSVNKERQEFTYGVAQALNSNVYSLNGWEFLGWSTNKDASKDTTNGGYLTTVSGLYTNGATIAADASLTPTANGVVKLYAIWRPYKLTITFDPNRPVNTPTSSTDLPKASSQVMKTVDSVTTAVTNDSGNIADELLKQTIVFDGSLKGDVKLDSLKYSLTGWHFEGWQEDANKYDNLANLYNKYAKTSDQSITLKALWEPNVYKVVFDANNANAALVNTSKLTAASSQCSGTVYPVTYAVENNKVVATYIYDVEYLVPNRPTTATANDPETGVVYTVPGYHVTKWGTNPTTGDVENTTKVKNLTAENGGTVTLTATWAPNTYTVKFVNTSTNPHGEETQTFTYDQQSTMLRQNTFTNSDTTKNFNGWTLVDKAGTTSFTQTEKTSFIDGEYVKNLTTVRNGVVVLETKWDAFKEVNYIYNGTNAEDSTTEGNPINITNRNIKKVFSDTPSKNKNLDTTTSGIKRIGYEFNGFYPDAEFKLNNLINLDQLGEYSSINNAYKVYEKWTPITYKVTLMTGTTVDDAVYGEYDKKAVNFDESITVANPTREGYTFVGWFTEGNEVPYNHAYTGTIADSNKFILTIANNDEFDANNKSMTLVNLSETQGAEVTLFAHWVKNSYNVAFDANNAVRTKLNATTTTSDSVAPANPTTLTQAYDDKSTSMDAYNVDNVLPEVTRAGYKLKGWALDANETVESKIYAAGTKLNAIGDDKLGVTTNPYGSTKTKTLHAIWEANTFSITFHGNDDTVKTSERVNGSTAAIASVDYDKEVKLTANGFSKTGYDFAGWATTAYGYGETAVKVFDNQKVLTVADLFDYVDQNNKKVNVINDGQNIDLYAVWTPHKYTVVFDKNDGDNDIKVPEDDMESLELTFDQDYYNDGVALTANEYTRAGYTFAGWLVTTGALENQSLDDGARVKNLTTESNAIESKGVVTLKAKWVANNSAVVVDASGNTVALTGATAWIDGQPATVNTDGSVKVNADAKVLTVYTFTTSTDAYNDGVAKHNVKPDTMKVYTLTTLADGNKVAKELTAFNNIFEYRGTSIRLTGNKGIRIKTGITKANRDALLDASAGLNGYYALEYGTVMAWADSLNQGDEPTLGYVTVGKAAKGYAYNRAAGYDKVFEWKNDNQNNQIAVFTNVLTGSWTTEQCAKDFAMRPYVILRPVNAVDESTDIVVYGATVYRSIKYVANQALNAVGQNQSYWYYATNSSEYNFFVNSLGGTARTTANYYGPVQSN